MPLFMKCAYCSGNYYIESEEIHQVDPGMYVCIKCLIERHQKLVSIEMAINSIKSSLKDLEM
jgi:hypothetical protein